MTDDSRTTWLNWPLKKNFQMAISMTRMICAQAYCIVQMTKFGGG